MLWYNSSRVRTRWPTESSTPAASPPRPSAPMRTASPTAPGDLARRSAGVARAAAVHDIGPTGRAPSPPQCPSYRLRPPRRTERHDDRDETDGHRGAGAGRHRPDRVLRRSCPSLARGGGDGDRRDRRPRARRPPRPRGPRRRRAGRPDPQAVQALVGPAEAGRPHGDRGRRPPDRRRALLAHRRAVHGRVARPDADRRAARRGRRREPVPRRRLQAALLAVLASRASGRRACACSPRRRRRPACRSSPS